MVLLYRNSTATTIYRFYSVKYPNVRYARLDMEKFLRKSELRNVWLQKVKPLSAQHKSSVSNLARILLLHRHGGAYLDTDTISRKPIPDDVPNFITHGI